MLKKVLLLLSGTLILVASSLYYINFSPQHTSTSKTYQYKKKPSTYQFQKLSDDTNTTTLPAAGSWKDDFPGVDNSKILGIAGQFNIFAKNIDSTANSGGLNGNFATENLTTLGNNQVTNGSSNKISYIQKNLTVRDVNKTDLHASKLVLGQSLIFDTSNLTLNNYTLKEPKPSTFTQDENDSKYVDIDSELARLSNNSRTIAMNTKNNQPLISGNQWSRVFDASNIIAQNNVKYLTVKSTDMPSGGLSVIGIEDNEKVVITIDTSGITTFSTGWSYLQSGTDDKNIIFNFYNTSQDSNYTGSVEWKLRNGDASNAILAPNATVSLAQTQFKGNIVALNFIKVYTINDSDNYPDVPVASNLSASTPKLESVPKVNFGSHKLRSETSLLGNWNGDFKVSGEKGQEIKINVSLAQNFKYANGKDTGVTWQLVKSDYSSGTLETSSQDISTTPASITYNDDGTGDLIASWIHNRENKQYIFYDIQISKLNSVTEAGDYTATLKWELADSP